MNIAAISFTLIFLQCFYIINGDVDDIPITPQEYFEVKNAMNFAGKVALITGSTSGIGATTARLFCYLGAKVVITGMNETRLKETVKECKELSPIHNKVTFN